MRVQLQWTHSQPGGQSWLGGWQLAARDTSQNPGTESVPYCVSAVHPRMTLGPTQRRVETKWEGPGFLVCPAGPSEHRPLAPCPLPDSARPPSPGHRLVLDRSSRDGLAVLGAFRRLLSLGCHSVALNSFHLRLGAQTLPTCGYINVHSCQSPVLPREASLAAGPPQSSLWGWGLTRLLGGQGLLWKEPVGLKGPI